MRHPREGARRRGYRGKRCELAALAESNLLVDLAPHLEDFIGDLFSITDEVRALQARHHELAPILGGA